MKTKKITKILTGMLLIVCMLITLFPGNFVFAEDPIPYTAPTITRFYPTNPVTLHIDISFPVEQNDDVYKLSLIHILFVSRLGRFPACAFLPPFPLPQTAAHTPLFENS